MIDVSLSYLSSLISIIPALIGLYILFDFIGLLLFGRN